MNKIICILMIFIFIYILLIIYRSYEYQYTLLNYYKLYKIDFDLLNSNLRSFNTSVSKEDDKYVFYTRIDDFYNDYNFKNCLMNKKREEFIGVTVYDKNFKKISYKIENCLDYFENRNHILEDFRVFFYKNKKYMLTNFYYNSYYSNFISEKQEQIFYPVVIDYNNRYNFQKNLIKIVDKDKNVYKGMKNFIPIIIGEDLYMIKNHNPLEIGKCFFDNKNNEILYNDIYNGKFNKNIPNIRGSTTYLSYSYDNKSNKSNKYIGIVHDVVKYYKKVYRHYFVLLDFTDLKNPYIERISKPFCFLGDCGIEFVMGFEETYDRKNYIISLGKEDKESYFIVMNKESINRLLYDI